MSGREYLRRKSGGVGGGDEHVAVCLFVFLHLCGGRAASCAGKILGAWWCLVRGGGGWGGGIADQGSRLLLLSTPLPPLSARAFPILKPRGKATAAVNLNRYNSCRPKQCTEGDGSERQRAAKVGTDRNNAPGRERGREGGEEGEDAVNCKYAEGC